MGPKQSMLEASGHQRLNREEFDHVTKLFKRICTNPEIGITYDDFENFCSDLHPLLVNFLLRFYFCSNQSLTLKSPQEFISLYTYLVRGSIEERTKVLELLLFDIEDTKGKRRSVVSGATCTPRKLYTIHVNFNISGEMFRTMLQNYLIGLICTYMKIENSIGGEEFLTWRKVRSRFSAEDVEKLALALEDDCQQPTDTGQLESWVKTWRTVSHLHAFIYDFLFKFEEPLHHDSIHSLFPLCVSRHSHNVCLMDMCSVMHINTYLPAVHNVKWRLLFSSILHGMSYKSMYERIIDTGATVVLIHDKKKYVFGGYAPHSWNPSNKYFGSHRAFVFQSQPDLKLFFASGENSNYQFMKNSKGGKLGRGIGMGGEVFGWWINPDEHVGLASPCDTFKDLPVIASSPNFQIEFIEVWGVDPVADSKNPYNTSKSIINPNYTMHCKGYDSNIHRAGKTLHDHAAGHGGYGKGYSDGYSTESKRQSDRDSEIRQEGNVSELESGSDWEDLRTDDSGSTAGSGDTRYSKDSRISSTARPSRDGSRPTSRQERNSTK